MLISENFLIAVTICFLVSTLFFILSVHRFIHAFMYERKFAKSALYRALFCLLLSLFIGAFVMFQ